MKEALNTELSNTPKLLANTISFGVGLAAFFNYKLLLMIPMNLLLAATKNTSLLEGISSLLIIACIYLAYKSTQRINALPTRKERKTKRIKTVIFGCASAVLTTTVLAVSNIFNH